MAMLAGAIVATPIVGAFCTALNTYEVIANLEVINRTSFFMTLSDYKVERGDAEHPPMNIGAGEILRCGFHKVNWSAFGVKSEIIWKLDENTRVELWFYVHYNSLVNFEDNELRLDIVTGDSRVYKYIKGDKLCSVTNGTVTINATIAEETFDNDKAVHYYLVFIDFRKSYDTIEWNFVWNALLNHGAKPLYVDMLRMIYEKAESKGAKGASRG